MYKRVKCFWWLAALLIMVLSLQGCSQNVSSTEDVSESVPEITPFVPTEAVETEDGTEEYMESTEEAISEAIFPSEAPPIGAIHIQTSGIGDEYVDAVVTVEGIEGISEEITEMNTRIKLRGNSSKLLAKKSYNLKFDEKISMFGMDSGKKWSLLATAYEKTMLRTPIGFWYAQQIGLSYVSQFYMTELWINGVYKGVYVVIEPVQEGKNRVDIDLDEGDFLLECNITRKEADVTYITTAKGLRFEINEPEEPTAEQKEAYLKWLNEAEEAIVSLDHNRYEEYIDVESFVNYYIFEELTKNVDFGRFSTRYYCKNNKLYAGPPWDLDLTMGNVSGVYYEALYHEYNNNWGYGLNTNDSTDGLWVDKWNWYQWLCKDAYFMDLVSKRWAELLPVTLNLVQENELGISRIDYFANGYSEYILRNYTSRGEGGAGWNFYKKSLVMECDTLFSTHAESVEYLRSWIWERIIWLDMEFNPNKAR